MKRFSVPVNKYMHPRNVYKKPPDFKRLAAINPEFAKYCQIDIKGKVTFDFTKQEALSCLSKMLLKTDFGLDVDIPLDTLVPTISLRLNYILWLEDVFEELCPGAKQLHGIDIGTGASCVYALLAAKKNGWKMLGTEINANSVEVAKQNVERNRLSDFVTVIHVPPDCCLVGAIQENENYDFCMCNPPFFCDEDDLNSSERLNVERSVPINCRTGSADEIIAPGGEVGFVKRIINDSVILKDKIKVYTTMLGRKSSLKPLLRELRSRNVQCIAKAQFFQGFTSRWGLAWSFCCQSLKSFLPTKKDEAKPIIWSVKTLKCDLNKCFDLVEDLLQRFKVKYERVHKSDDTCAWNVIAYENTWVHQRRQRRAERFKQVQTKVPVEEICSQIERSDDIVPSETASNPAVAIPAKVEIADTSGAHDGAPKRKYDSTSECEPKKKAKIDDDSDETKNEKETDKNEKDKKCKLEALLESNIFLYGNDTMGYHLEGRYVYGNKEAMHQLLQVIKNYILM